MRQRPALPTHGSKVSGRGTARPDGLTDWDAVAGQGKAPSRRSSNCDVPRRLTERSPTPLPLHWSANRGDRRGAEATLASPSVLPGVGWLVHRSVAQASLGDARKTLPLAACHGGGRVAAGKLFNLTDGEGEGEPCGASLTAALSAQPRFDPTRTPREDEIVDPGPFQGP